MINNFINTLLLVISMWTNESRMKNLLVVILIMLLASVSALAQDNQKIQLANEYYMQGDADKSLDIYGELASDLKAIPYKHIVRAVGI